MSTPVLKRFFRKVQIGDGCWLWTGRIGALGYAPLYWNGKIKTAHRFSFELFKGPVPKGLELDHICRTRHCVNPAHLRAVTHQVNILCGETVPARNAAKTHCLRGHEFTPANTYLNPRGERQCRACIRIRDRRFRRNHHP